MDAKLRFCQIDLKKDPRPGKPTQLAFLTEKTKLKGMPFFEAVPFLEELNRSLGTSISFLSCKSFLKLMNEENWNGWLAAVGNIDMGVIANLLFPMLPFIAVEKPDVPFAERVAFKPEFSLYDDVPTDVRQDKRIFVDIPECARGIRNALVAWSMLSSAEFRAEDTDYLVTPSTEPELIRRIPDIESYYKYEKRFGMPIGKEDLDTPKLPNFCRPRHAYAGPVFGSLELLSSWETNVFLVGDWSRAAAIVVEILRADIPKLASASMLFSRGYSAPIK